MEWISEITTLAAVLIGWFLNQATNKWGVQKENNRKLNKLLYYLLELRYQIDDVFEKENQLREFIHKYIERSKDILQIEDTSVNMNEIYSFFSSFDLSNTDEETTKELLSIQKNVDIVLTELAEIFPILAYELRGLDKIMDALNAKEKYFNDLNSIIKDNHFDPPPFDLKEFLEPELNNSIIEKLEQGIEEVSLKISKKTNKLAMTKILYLSSKDSDRDKKINDYIDSTLNRLNDLDVEL